MGHHHRAGSLRQSNKRHKSSSSSKRSLDRQAGSGRVKAKTTIAGTKKGIASSLAGSKANRVHASQQRREKSKQQLLMDRRRVSAHHGVPKIVVVGIVALSGESTEEATAFEEHVRDSIVSEASSSVSRCYQNSSTIASVSCRFESSKAALTLLTNSTAFYQCNLKRNSDPREDTREDAAIHAALDLVRVCDVVLFTLDGNMSNNRDDCEAMMSERGERMLTALKAQGLPTPLTALCFGTNHCSDNTSSKKLKHRGDIKRYVQRMATTEFGQDAKVLEVSLRERPDNDIMDTNEGNQGISNPRGVNSQCMEDESINKRNNSVLVRTLCQSSFRPCKWCDMRSHMVSDGGFAGEQSHGGFFYNTEMKELAIQGYLRGAPPLDVNKLVHVPHVGTFAIKCVMDVADPLLPLKSKKTKTCSNDNTGILTENEEVSHVLLKSDPSMRNDSLNPYASPNSLEGEQNLIGFNCDGDNDLSSNGEHERTDTVSSRGPRPAGWSDYQSSWLDALGDTNFSDDDDEEEEDIDHGELGDMLNMKNWKGSSSGAMIEDDGDLSISSMERVALAEKRNKEHKKELDFPDEVELKREELARERFARYRSLKSFRKSHWDPKENLPESYADIYHFASFRATQNDVFNEVKRLTDAANTAQREGGWRSGSLEKDSDVEMDAESVTISAEKMLQSCVASGSYVRVILEGVSQSAYERLQHNSLLTMVSLLPHENKVSVLHMGVCQTSTCEPGEIPVKSKDLLTFRCGWRTWQGRPIFSQNNLNSDKHKFERFLPANAFVAVSVFGPVSYTPCPVLVFREPSKDNGRRQLVALGTMIGADADRVVVKRIVLTGYPVRVHKRNATVKYMFFNPDDVKWFKPAGLTTKHGLQGHIMESVGEHGTMKCLFNKPIKQHDTVCLPLYKRVYPKYGNCSNTDGERDERNSSDGGERLIVL